MTYFAWKYTIIAVLFYYRGDKMIKVNETCYRLKGRDLFVLKNHSHNEIEFIFVINGSGMVLKND